MDRLHNRFNQLELDADDDRVMTTVPVSFSSSASDSDSASASSSSAASSSKTKPLSTNKKTGKSEKKVNSSNLPVENEVSLVTSSSGKYKMPLVWIDMEMTGLNIEVDRILEIACIITDGKLTKSVEGPDLVIRQSKECLDKMGEWCQSHHEASGLTNKVLQSKVDEKEAERQVIEFVKKHVGPYTPQLAGNSVYVDFQFLKKYMPDLASLFFHVVVDVSSVKALCLRWYPRDQKKAPAKENKHRALDDIKESIMELKYYKANIFKQNK